MAELVPIPLPLLLRRAFLEYRQENKIFDLPWLGGSRVIELKTIQILDELTIPRPCIDATNVGYNVEWSQELKLEQSLREYVGAAMFLEILKASKLLGED